MGFRRVVLGVIPMLLSSGCALGGFQVGGSGSVSGGASSSALTEQGVSSTKKLAKVTNISYDATSKILSWDAVDHADEYNVDINGSTQQAGTNSIYFVPVEQTSNIKVQACDSTDKYVMSDWSDTFTYTFENEDKLTLAEVNTFVNGLKASYKLKSLTSMYITSENSEGILCTQGTFTVNGVDEVVSFQTRYDSLLESFSDAMTKEYTRNIIEEEYIAADYNSAQYLIDSNSYVGKMEEYRQQGWNFSVVSSCVGAISSDTFRIFATYGLTKNNESKFIQSSIECGIKNASTSERTNYTTKLLYESERDLEELSCNEYTGDLVDVAKLLEESRKAQQELGS